MGVGPRLLRRASQQAMAAPMATSCCRLRTESLGTFSGLRFLELDLGGSGGLEKLDNGSSG